MLDLPSTPDRPPLWKELSDGTASVAVKIVVTFALALLLTGATLIGGYFIAALNPAWDRYGPSSFSPRPSDELMLVLALMAGVSFLVGVAWLWSRGRTNRTIIYTAVLSVAVVGVTIGLCVLVETQFRGDRELLMAGIIFLGAAALLLMWLFAVRRRGAAGRPARNAEDGLLDVLCPACGYRMVGLRESRCPECGAAYTLDELLTRQRFAPAPGRTVPPLPPVPPAPAEAAPAATQSMPARY